MAQQTKGQRKSKAQTTRRRAPKGAAAVGGTDQATAPVEQDQQPQPPETPEPAPNGNGPDPVEEAPALPGGAVSLSDLSPEDQQRLLAEAKREVTASEDDEQVTAEAEAKRLDDARRQLMHVRDHLRECPLGEPGYEGEGRVELYGDRTPPRTDKATGMIVAPPEEVTVVHCLECGGTTMLREPIDQVNGRLYHNHEEVVA